jgi:hypothetical protein
LPHDAIFGVRPCTLGTPPVGSRSPCRNTYTTSAQCTGASRARTPLQRLGDRWRHERAHLYNALVIGGESVNLSSTMPPFRTTRATASASSAATPHSSGVRRSTASTVAASTRVSAAAAQPAEEAPRSASCSDAVPSWVRVKTKRLPREPLPERHPASSQRRHPASSQRHPARLLAPSPSELLASPSELSASPSEALSAVTQRALSAVTQRALSVTQRALSELLASSPSEL